MRVTVLAAMSLAVVLSVRAGAQDTGGPSPGSGAREAKWATDPSLPLNERATKAIDLGVAWLKGDGSVAGSFGGIGLPPAWKRYDGKMDAPYDYPAGATALAMFTLLKCGVPPADPVIQKGFAWLEKKERIPGTAYEISMLILAIEARTNPYKSEQQRERDTRLRLKPGEKLKLGVKLPPKDAAWMKELLAELLRRRHGTEGWRYGFWDPSERKFDFVPPGDSDMSSTQLAMLAILAAERCGFTQPDKLYLSVVDWVLSQQEPRSVASPVPGPGSPGGVPAGGASPPPEPAVVPRGWAYMNTSPDDLERRVTGGMTACGLSNIAICARVLEARRNASYRGSVQDAVERAWYDGEAWLGANWAVDRNPGKDYYHLYYLYCLERVGDLTGLYLIATHNWYTEGAQVLVDAQFPDGHWTRSDTHTPEPLLNTCFALLFLKRSTPAITGE